MGEYMKKLILIIILMMLFISGCNVSEKKYEEFKKITIEESGYTFVSSACYSDNHSYYLFKEIIEKELKSINKNYKLVDNQMINQDGVNDRIYFQIDYKYSKKMMKQ